MDWDGEIVWKFDRTELVEGRGGEPRWMARMHHDWRREGSPVGYYAPNAEPMVDQGRTLILAHRNVLNPEISDKLLEDDYIVEITWDGDITWEWLASDHIDEYGFSGEARNTLYRYPGWNEARVAAYQRHVIRRPEPMVRRGRRAVPSGECYVEQPPGEHHRHR